jgi:diaminopimelate epimerase
MRFSKWHALGNAYLLVERAEAGSALAPELVRRLCDVHVGVGSDGVLEVVSVEDTTAELVIWNPDGTTAELSGNGVRIAARWLSARTGSSRVGIRVGPREVSGVVEDSSVQLQLGEVEVGELETIDVQGELVELTPVSVGNPHAVVRREPARETLLRLGPLVETHPRFPERTNVQLVRVDGPREVTARVWERGVGETMASGTSAVAVAAAAIANQWCDSPVTVRMPGGVLAVTLDAENRATLTGPAEEICRGEIAV